jgi:hypothetical protein
VERMPYPPLTTAARPEPHVASNVSPMSKQQNARRRHGSKYATRHQGFELAHRDDAQRTRATRICSSNGRRNVIGS